jgi:hypothetical protein
MLACLSEDAGKAIIVRLEVAAKIYVSTKATFIVTICATLASEAFWWKRYLL